MMQAAVDARSRRRSSSCRRGPATCSTGTRSPGGRSRRSRWRRSRARTGCGSGGSSRPAASAKVTLDLQNRVGGPWQASNVVAEIRGAEKPERDRAARSPPRLVGPRHGGARQRRQLRARDRSGAGDRRGPEAEAHDPVRALHAARRAGFWGRSATCGRTGTSSTATSRVVIHDIGDGKVTGYFTNGRPGPRRAGLKAILAPVAAWGADTAERRSDPRNGQLRLPPRGRAQPRRQPGDGALPRRLPRRVGHVRQGGSRDRRATTRPWRRSPSLGLANAPIASGPRQTRAEVDEDLLDADAGSSPTR